VKTNYVLRGLSVPAGKHAVEFRFEPASYVMGRQLTTVSQVVLGLLLVLALFLEYYRNRKTAGA
jgi:uncharacterized membrane protein YfhO